MTQLRAIITIALGLIAFHQLAKADPNIIQNFAGFDGKMIRQIQFQGLKRTHEQAARWLMHSTEGSSFDAATMQADIQALYNTNNLYDIMPQITENPDGTLNIIITVDDKWTLLPFFGAQGGGGSLVYGGGLYDTNLLGYFVAAQVSAFNFNGRLSYDLNLDQEYVMGTPYMAHLDVGDSINPMIVHHRDDTSAGSYVWERRQISAMGGYHWAGPIRLMTYFDLFSDSLLESQGVNAFVTSGLQWKFHPKLIFGRANIINFLEEGTELTFHPFVANTFDRDRSYSGIEINYKVVWLTPRESNIGIFLSAEAMTVAPPPYEFQVGGYYNVRGFIDGRQAGPYAAHANVEYRPLLFKTRLPLIDLVAIQGCVFSDAGSAWGDDALTGEDQTKRPDFLWSAGAGIRFNFLHFAGAIVRFDIARALHPAADSGGFSFGVGQFF